MLLKSELPGRNAFVWLIPLGILLLARQFWAIAPFGSNEFQVWVSSLIAIPVNLAAAVVCLWVSRQNVDARASWHFIGLGMLSFAVGDMIYASYQIRGLDPFPSPADFFYIGTELLLLIGFVRLPRPPFRRLEVTRVVLNVAIITLGIGMLIWYLVLGRAVLNHHGQWLPLFTSLVYPTVGLALFAFLLLYVMRTNRYRLGPEVLFLATGMVCMIVADAAYVWRCFSPINTDPWLRENCLGQVLPANLERCNQLMMGGMSLDWPLAAGWQWAAFFFALAALWDWRNGLNSMPMPTQTLNLMMDDEALEGARSGISRFLSNQGMYLAIALLFVLHFVSRDETGIERDGVEIASGLMVLLVVIRQYIALADNQRLTDELRGFSQDLEKRVQQRTQELEASRSKLQESERLERERNDILEMIVRDESLDVIMIRLEELYPGSQNEDVRSSMIRNMQLRERLTKIASGRHEMINQLAHQATHDALTGLPNRVLVQRRLEEMLLTPETRPNPEVQTGIGVMFIDLDRFKQINDTLGHPLGDRMLIAVAKRFQSRLDAAAEAERISPQSVLGRTGGDEFVVALPDLHDPEAALQLGESIVSSLRDPFLIDDHELFVDASVGIAVYPDDGTDSSTLMRHADTAMYRAKQQGGGVQRFTPEMTVSAQEKLELENDLRKALERKELQVYYQPLVDLQTQELRGFEALLRWQHPKLGLMPPAKFIPVAEESGLILPIGTWVLEQACRQNATWQREGLKPVRVSVNVSAPQFDRPDFLETVTRALAQAGLRPEFLELEVLESMLVTQLEESIKRMDDLRALGVKIALDDFGTGYSSLSYLQRLPIDTLKIDRSFISALESNDPNSSAERRALPLIQAILTMAHSLELQVMAEGVERVEQMQTLIKLGAQGAQGYFFSPPVPVAAARKLLEHGRFDTDG
jgi:diguanylate cyclase